MTKQLSGNRGNQALFTNDEKIVFTLDVAGNIQFINEAAERLCGYSSAEAGRLNVMDLLPVLRAEDVRAQAMRSIRQRFGTVFEIEITTRDRRQVRVETSIDLVRGSDGTLEFHGIAVAKNDAGSSTLRPRCLDIHFQFRAARQFNAELQAAW